MDNTFDEWINEKLVKDGFVTTKQVISKFHCPLDQSTKKLASFYDTYSVEDDFTALYQMCSAEIDEPSAAYRFDIVQEKNLQHVKDSEDKILFLEITAVGRPDVDIMKEYFDKQPEEDVAKQIGFVRYPNKRHSTVIDAPQSSSTRQDSILSPSKKVTVKSGSLENSKKADSKKQKQGMSSFFKKSSAKAEVDTVAASTTKKARFNENSSMTALKDMDTEVRDTKKSNKTLTLDPTLFSADSSPESSPVKKAPIETKETSDDLKSQQSKKRKSNTVNAKKKTKNAENFFKNDKKIEIENEIKEADKNEAPIKRKKMVHNTYLDEDGYLVTMKESRTEIVPKPDTKTEGESKLSVDMKNGSSESTGNQKLSTRNEKPSDSKSSRKDNKTVDKAQSTLTSFFKK